MTPSQETIDEFVTAAHGNMPKVREMLAQQPALINARSTLDETPLGAAAHAGNRAMAEYLLSQGAELDLPAAAMLGMQDVVREQVDSDPALANAAGAHGIPVLFHAAIGGNFELAQYLAGQGADTGPQVSGTLLHAAVRAGHRDMAAWALDLGADVNALYFDSNTPLQRAIEAGSDDIAALLREHGATAS
jgi:ankyrin repeat protein